MKDMQKIRNYWPGNQAPLEERIHIIIEASDFAGESKI
jgi:hypothetical protein